MSTPLSIINSFTATINGRPLAGFQGTSDDIATDEFDITLTGQAKQLTSQLATDAVLKVYDDAVDTCVADLLYLWYKADQRTYIQILTAATNVIIGPLAANVPISIGAYSSLKLLAEDDNITAITGGAEPSTADVKQVYIGNYSGSVCNFEFWGFN